MAYEPKPGSFSLFRNEKKEKETHPDYRGDGLDIEGRPVWVSAWLKDGKNGRFMSCTFQLKDSLQAQKSLAKSSAKDMDDDVPL